MATGKKNPWIRIPRDTLLLLSGIGLTMNEAIFRHGPERPYMIMLFAGMMGLPLYLRNDEKKSSASEYAQTESAPAAKDKPKAQLERRALRLTSAIATLRLRCSSRTSLSW